MSDQDRRFGAGTVIASLVIVGLVAFIVVGAVVRLAPQQNATGPAPSGPDTATTAPGSEPSPAGSTPLPTSTLEGELGEHLPEVYNPDVSNVPEPTEAQIWEYERAYNTPNPDEREARMAKIATEQYMSDAVGPGTGRWDGIAVEVVDVDIKRIEVGDNAFSAYVMVDVVIETSRDGKVVNKIPLPTHVSLWVNSPRGWRVAEDIGSG